MTGAPLTEVYEIGPDTRAVDLIPGDPTALRTDASTLRAIGDEYDDAATVLGRLDVGPWEGMAADAFAAALAQHRARLVAASDAFTAAGRALDAHADVLVEARERATEGIEAYLVEQRCTPPTLLGTPNPGPTPGQTRALLALASAIRAAGDSEHLAARALRAAADVGPGGTSPLDALRPSENPWHTDPYSWTETIATAAIVAVPGGGAGAGRAGGLTTLDRSKIAMYEALAARSTNAPWQRALFAGSRFNWENYHHYLAREVWITDNAAGVRYRLDSYTPGDAVVARRHTQLGDITELSGKRYLEEIMRKYNPDNHGLLVADTAWNRTQLPAGPGGIGDTLLGRPILEVPVQAIPVPDSVLQRASLFGIRIRDTAGNIYQVNP